MENLMGLLRIHVIRGVNLAVRDVCSSDPYVVVKMGKQVLHMFSWTGSCVSLLISCIILTSEFCSVGFSCFLIGFCVWLL